MPIEIASGKRTSLVLFIGLLSVCCAADQQVLAPTREAPASLGEVTTHADANGNTLLRVEVDHLPPPDALAPELRNYVVWVRPAGGYDYLNVGQLKISDERSGELETTTPHSDFDVLVTAEASGAPTQPSAHVILQGRARKES